MSDRVNKLQQGAPERRSVAASDFELRADGDSLMLTGYASVFEAPYDVFGGPKRGGWTEIVDRKAFDKTLREKPDVHLLVNHEGLSLARTKSGTLGLSTDRTGLKVSADLDRRDPDVQRLEVKMGRKDIDEMSFAFRAVAQEWNEDESERRLTEVSIHKGDVSVVNNGANPATSAAMRGLGGALETIAGLEFDAALAEVRALTSATPEEVRQAAEILHRLAREATPPEKRTLSIADAMKLIDAT